MANTTALAAARHHVLAATGWDVETEGLAGAPAIRLIVGEEVHVTVPRAARFLGLGTRSQELSAEPGIVVLNDVVLNQALLRFLAPSGRDEDHDARTRAVIAAVQDDGTCWVGGSVWWNQTVMRISVSNFATTDADVTASAVAIISAARQPHTRAASA